MKNAITVMHYVCLILGFGLEEIKEVVGIIAFTVSIVLGVITIILKLKLFLKDGKLTEEELQELLNDVDNLKKEKSDHE